MKSSPAAVSAPAAPAPVAAEADTWLTLGEIAAEIVADLVRNRAEAAFYRDTVVTRKKSTVTRIFVS